MIIKFSASGRPDSAGLRLMTTDPAGVLVSLADPDRAKEVFLHLTLLFIARTFDYNAVRLHADVEWDKVLASGEGAVEAQQVTAEEAAAVVTDPQSRKTDAVARDYEVLWYRHRLAKNLVCIAGDLKGPDVWLLNQVTVLRDMNSFKQ